MAAEANNKLNTIKKSQNRYVPIILWLFPLLLLNVGWHFFGVIDNRWKEQEEVELAKQETESLSASSDFSYCFGTIAGDFSEELKSGTESFSGPKQRNNLNNYIKSRAEFKFRAPFPEHELFVFHIPCEGQKAEFLYSNVQNLVGKRALAICFEYLVRVSSYDPTFSESDRSKGAEIIRNIFGGSVGPKNLAEDIAETQKGKTTFAIYKEKPYWFLWDSFVCSKSGGNFGYFLMAANNKASEASGKLLALRNLRESQKQLTNKKLGAFIPIFPGYEGIVACEELQKMPEFSVLARKWVPKDSNGLYDWQCKGAPSKPEETTLGNYKAFFHVAPNQSHAAVLFAPMTKIGAMPLWLYVVNIAVVSIILLLLLRGFLLGAWPKSSLRFRFISTYFLAACLPLGLMLIASYGYISEYKHTALFKNQSHLRMILGQFDTRKNQYQELYKTAFADIQNDRDLKEAFKRLDKANSQPISMFANEHKAVLHRLVDILNKNGRRAPVTSINLIDEMGNCLSSLGNSRSFYYRTADGKDYYPDGDSFTYEEKKRKITNDIALEPLIYPFITSLRGKIQLIASDSKKWTEEFKPTLTQETAIGGFRKMMGSGFGGLAETFDKRSNLVTTRTVGNQTISNIHDYVSVDGVPRFIIYMTWDESSLDEESFRASLEHFSINEPDYVFSSYKSTAQGVKPWVGSGRHGRAFEKDSLALANQANFRKSYATSRDEFMSIVAMPSQKYHDVIFVGAVSNHALDMLIFTRVVICFAIIVLASIILLACIYYSSTIFLRPISNLKESLDKIAEGEFDLQIKSSSQDEFGVMSREFGLMTKSLSERNKLATLISDHAVEALSRGADSEDGPNVETFTGTVLVSDIRNFTGMCESHEPDKVTDLLNEHFARMTKIVSDNGGRIYKYIGDAIEVVFADKDDLNRTSTERAFITAKEMLNCLKAINGERLEKGLFEYKIGVGLSYGSMSSGTIGSLDTRLDYAILGDALKEAGALESLSRQVPDFPLVANRNFVEAFQKKYAEIEFKSLSTEDELDAYVVTSSGLAAFERQRGKSASAEVDNRQDLDKKTEDTKETKQVSIEIEKEFSFYDRFIPGFIFVALLSIIMVVGIYFVYTTANNSEKLVMSMANQRELGQILCEEYGKTAIDLKCRKMAFDLYKKIEDTKEENLTNEVIESFINKIFEEDKSLKNIGFKKVFFRFNGSEKELPANDPKFVHNIQFLPLANSGYSQSEVEKISKCFQLQLALDRLSELADSKTTDYAEKEAFTLSAKRYLAETLGEPTREVFGEKMPVTYFVTNAKNSTSDAVMDEEPSYLFWLDFYKGKDFKFVGNLICSVPTKAVKESLPLLLSAYSKNDGLVALKNQKTEEWYFSDNVPEYVRQGAIASEKERMESGFKIKDQGNPYLYQLLGASNRAEITIGENKYDLYITRVCSLNKGNPRNALIWVFLCVGFVAYVMWQISVGKSRINRSVAAKLWLALLIVAVIPVLTVFFVFGLFRSEYYAVKTSLDRYDMQRYRELFELKEDFMPPLAWNYVRKQSNSKEISENAAILNDVNKPESERLQALRNIRKITQSWVEAENNYSPKEKILLNYSITDISMTGKNGFTFSFADKEDKLEATEFSVADITKENQKEIVNVSYLEPENEDSTATFGLMMKQIAKSLISSKSSGNQNEKVSKDSMASEMAMEVGLKTVKTFFGEDVALRLSHGIYVPTMLNSGMGGRLGLYISPFPDFKNPEYIMVWVLNFASFKYLSKLAEIVDGKYNVYMTESLKTGHVVHTKDNSLRIPLGEYASWIFTSNLPISTSLKINGVWHLIEGSPALRVFNSLLLLTYPETKTLSEINRITLGFYFLLGISLLIIITTTRNIADDIINPINSLIEGIKEVNKENFAYRIGSDRTDELGALCLSFDRMAKGLDEKRLMSKMISKTAQKVTLKEGAEATRKTETVLLYVGIPNFSSWMTGLRDYEIFSLLQKQTAIIAGIVMENGGEVDKIMGEKLLAVFRVKGDMAKSCLAACEVARRIVDFENTSNMPFPVAIGINNGNVINGFLGIGNKRDFTVIGDAVNVTARIESLAERLRFNRCLVSEDVYNVISRDLTTRAYGDVELKGKSQTMKVYQLT